MEKVNNNTEFNQTSIPIINIYLPYNLKIKILNYKCDYVGIEY